jgi:small subunit ribosomal protein S20
MRNAMKDLREDADKASAATKLPKVIAMVDKLAKKNVIHKNKAANLKSKLTKKVNALKK